MPEFEREPVLTLHRLRAPGLQPPSSVDDGTWADLDLDQVLDSVPAISELGRLVLYGWLRCPALMPADFAAVAERRQAEPAEAGPVLRASLGKLPRLPGLLVASVWGKQALPTLGPWPAVMATVALLGLLTFALSVKLGLVASALLFLTNFGLHLWWDKQVNTGLASIEFIALALSIGLELAGNTRLSARTRATLQALNARLKPLRRSATEYQAPPPFNELAVYRQILTLTAERRLTRCAALLERHREPLRQLLELLGALDANQALEAFQAQQQTCTPTLGTNAELVLEGLRHPLLGARAVPSSARIAGVLVITGSNMSGKSTFLRSVAINSLFAQGLGFSCASLHAGPFLRVVSSLRVVDELREGRSTYLAEAQRIKALLVAATSRTLFVIDEPFRGTNSRERIAASVALFNHLGRKGHLALGATHDLEVALEAQKAGATLAHFRDGLTAQGLSFDFTLRSGISTGRNALELLRFLEYPAELIAEALRLASDEHERPAP